MKLKDSLIIILAVIIAIVVGVFVGYKLSENKKDDNVTNNGTTNNNNQEQNNSESDKEENNDEMDNELEEYEKKDYDLKENLKSKNISFIDPLTYENLVYNSEKMTNTKFSLGNKEISVIKNNSKLIIKNSSGKEISFDIDKIDDEERTFVIYKINNLFYVAHYLNAGTDHIIYNSDLTKIVDGRIDEMALPLIVGNSIYYGLGTCDGPGEFGDVAVYKYDLNTKKTAFQFYLAHFEGWAC